MKYMRICNDCKGLNFTIESYERQVEIRCTHCGTFERFSRFDEFEKLEFSEILE